MRSLVLSLLKSIFLDVSSLAQAKVVYTLEKLMLLRFVSDYPHAEDPQCGPACQGRRVRSADISARPGEENLARSMERRDFYSIDS